MEILDHLTSLLRNLYAGQEATVRTRHGTMEWIQIGKGVWQGCILSAICNPAYLTDCRVQSVKCQSGWIISWNQDCLEKYQQPQICRWYNSNGRNWRGTNDESERGEWKVGLKLNIQKTRIMASGPITSWKIDGETVETVTNYFSGLQNHCRWWLQTWN